VHGKENWMELYRNAYRIQSLYGDRNLFQYLFVGEKTILVDSGIAETPEKAIFPYMDRLKIDPARLSMVVTTHPDLDHQGGNSAIKSLAPQAQLTCGEADREMVEDPHALFRLRYNFAKAEHGVGFASDEPWPDCGKAQAVDAVFHGGERIWISDGWEMDVLHVPGHSHGHLALYDAKHRAAFVSDAIHGRGCPNANGELGIPVTYYFVDAYLSTLQHFENLNIDVLYSGHWPTMRGEEIRHFIAESRRTVEFLDRVILRSLTTHEVGLALKEIVDTVAEAVGEWPRETWFLTTFPVKGHLDRLEQQGKVRIVRGEHLPRWQLK
jgi:glyoxylase-like metal-dependent hydrolase (beta-lactamase superfamily II)